MAKTIPCIVGVGLMLAAGAFPVRAQAQRLPQTQRLLEHAERHDHAPAPVILTVSGGKSLGSYQAGVNWALVRALRRSLQPNDQRASSPLDRPMRLIAATGASAGNINALISAVEWCDESPFRPPEESLFWKTWIWTGWEQLLPQEPYRRRETRTESILHREFFETHYENISAVMAEARSEGCRLPVGVTLTRLVPGVLELGVLDIPIQRYFSIFEVRTVPSAPGGIGPLEFAPADSALRDDRSLGRGIFIDPGQASSVPRDDVYLVTAASSAFPLAFEPIQLSLLGEVCGVGETPCSRAYLDGGLFDNSPLDLAFGLYDHVTGSGPASGEPDDHPRLIYIDAGELRGGLRDRRAPSSEVEERRGVGAGTQMVSGAIPSARKYELQSLARHLVRSGGEREEWMRATSRAHPILGEHLGGFGAFFGRPFREFDFYVGVYDALHYLADELCLEERGTARKGPADCLSERLRELIEDRGLVLGPTAPSVLAALYRWEYSGRPAPRVAPDPDPDHGTAMEDLRRATVALTEARPTGCGALALLERLLCSDRLGEVLDSLRASEFRSIIRGWAEGDACSRRAWRTSSMDCEADRSLVELVDNPEHFLSQSMERVIRQLWRVERTLDERGHDNYLSAVQFVELWFRSAGVRYRRGLELLPSTVPEGERFPRVVLRGFPFFASVAAGTRGGEVVGYRPTWHLGRRWALVAPVSLHFVRPVQNPDERWRWRGSLGLLWKVPNLGFSGLEVTIDRLRAFEWTHSADTGPRTLTGGSLTGYLLAGKVTVTVRGFLENGSEAYNGDRVAVLVGVSDLNGILYWATRGLF